VCKKLRDRQRGFEILSKSARFLRIRFLRFRRLSFARIAGCLEDLSGAMNAKCIKTLALSAMKRLFQFIRQIRNLKFSAKNVFGPITGISSEVAGFINEVNRFLSNLMN